MKKKNKQAEKPLILGLGNYLMGDEGIGCHAIKYLEKGGYGEKADLLDGGTGGFHLMDHLVSHSSVIMIDATLDHFPEGNVRVIEPKVADDFPHNMSTHDIGLKDLVSSLTLTEQLPELYLIAVSVKDYSELRITLSDKLANSLPLIEEKVNKILTYFEEKALV